MPLATPSYGGDAIFGFAAKIRTADVPRSRQENAYPGIDGVEAIDLGMRGSFSFAQGWLYGDGLSGLIAAEEGFRSYIDNVARVLVDTRGYAWNNVILDSFEPDGRGYIDQTTGFCYRVYSARFRHLT